MRTASHRDFFPERYSRRLEAAKDIPAIFDVVKDAVMETEGWSRSGLQLCQAEMEGSDGSYVGAVHPLGTNVIVLNAIPLRIVKESHPELYNAYVFDVLIHEYVHTIGIVDTVDTRKRVLDITCALFGEEHAATQLVEDLRRVLPFVTYPHDTCLPEGMTIQPV